MNRVLKYYAYLHYKNLQVWFSIILLVFLVLGNSLLIYWTVANFTFPNTDYAVQLFSFPTVVFSKMFRIILLATPFLSIFLSSLIFGNDYLTGAIRTPVLRGQSRIKAYLGKLGTITGNITMGFIVSGLLGIVSLYFVSKGLGFSVTGISGEQTWILVRAAIILALVVCAYVALVGFVVTLTRSSMMGLTIGTLFYLFEVLIADALQFPWSLSIRPFLLYNHAMTLLTMSEDFVMPTFSWGSFAIIVLYCAILTGGGVWVFVKQDIKE